ncbi:MAG TPA: hypothetical protein VNA12_04875 [Mycobacteriales bacterium]|nr:hypothetical protein [Mycobacteriales bacterium]
MLQFAGPELTAEDYLLVVADQAAERGQAFADIFRLMLAESRTDGSLGDRALRPHEATPVDVIARAYEAAVRRRDRAAQHEIVMQGLALLARWPAFLLDVTAGADSPAGEAWPTVAAS